MRFCSSYTLLTFVHVEGQACTINNCPNPITNHLHLQELSPEPLDVAEAAALSRNASGSVELRRTRSWLSCFLLKLFLFLAHRLRRKRLQHPGSLHSDLCVDFVFRVLDWRYGIEVFT